MTSRDAPGDNRDLLVGEVADVHARCLVRLIQTPLEQVRELVKFAEFPLGVWGVCPAAYVRRVLVVFLMEPNE